MDHRIYRVESCEVVGPYTLCIKFDDGAEQVIDFAPVLKGELYGPLVDPELFSQVTIDPEVHTLTWPNGADFDPATLHEWPKHIEALRRMAQQWTPVPTGTDQGVLP
jgi:hypothetical protein